MKNIINQLAILICVFIVVGCAPGIGTVAWCEKMDEKPKGDWSANEAKEYAKNCIFRKSND